MGTPAELKARAWLAARQATPVTAIDEHGYGRVVEPTLDLAMSRLDIIEITFNREWQAQQGSWDKHRRQRRGGEHGDQS